MPWYTDKEENYEEIQTGAVAKLFMRKRGNI
jgi:hypothetical protein